MTKKIIGLYELITGIFGVILILANYLTKGKAVFSSAQVIQQIILGVLLFGFLAYAGYGLLNNLKNARRYSMALQAFQIPLFYFSGLIYKFTAAGFFSVGLQNGKFAFNWSFQPIDFIVASNSTDTRMYMIYIVPIIILYGLSKVKGS